MEKYIKKYYLIAQYCLGIVFILSSLLKQITFEDFVMSIQMYKVLPEEHSHFVALFVCIIEVLIGIMIFFNIYGKTAIKVAIIMMTFFTIFSLWSVILNKDWTCNCFGSFFSQKINYAVIIRNITILILLMIVHKNFIAESLLDKIKNKALLIVIILFITASPFLYKTLYTPTTPLKMGDTLLLDDLITIDNNIIRLKNIRGNKIFFIFSLSDCSSCLEEALFWKNLNTEFDGKIYPMVIVNSPNFHTLNAFLKHKKVTFNVIFDHTGILIQSLHTNTPTKILVNDKNIILDISPMLGSEKAFNYYLKKIKTIINKTQPVIKEDI